MCLPGSRQVKVIISRNSVTTSALEFITLSPLHTWDWMSDETQVINSEEAVVLVSLLVSSALTYSAAVTL